ncbi:hypothetical protein IWQ62_000106 [Dispira parvispora]|uniref:YqeG family HAD IIIA-type phosphatase n=1 Tax=Dispira parvispora TaxID=1520584 RepID=A0A9W8B1E2_9FUNG|nr:hypothetical protein IWQ62_000106 [Dispira parvispora]
MVQSINNEGLKAVRQVLLRPGLLLPHATVPDIRHLDFARLKASGIKAVAFDKDNCLTRPYETRLYPPFQEAWKQCQEVFSEKRIAIVSNSAGTLDDPEDRQALAIEQSLGVPVLRHQVKKPGGGDGLLEHFGSEIQPTDIAFVGDRLMTDVLYGNRYGFYTVWTTQVVSLTNDNPVAVRLRRFEYALHRFLGRFSSIQSPYHPVTERYNALH